MNKELKVVMIVVATITGLVVLGFAAFGVRSLIVGAVAPSRIEAYESGLMMGRGNMMQNRFDSFTSATAEENIEESLDAAVEAGLITSEQKTLILEERDTIQERITEINNQQLTTTERENAHSQLMDEVYEWSNTNNISISYLGLGGQMRMHNNARTNMRLPQ